MKEALIDTNIFVRHFLGDIPQQAQKAKEVFNSVEKKEKTGLVSILVINELIWILEKYYNLKRKVFLPKILKLLVFENLKILEAKKDILIEVLEKMQKQKFDFTDLYLNQVANGREIVSFDKDFEKIKKGRYY